MNQTFSTNSLIVVEQNKNILSDLRKLYETKAEVKLAISSSLKDHFMERIVKRSLYAKCGFKKNMRNT